MKQWILRNGVWDDSGAWDDGDVWRDNPLIKPNVQQFRRDDEFSDRMFYPVSDVNFIQQLNLFLFNDTFVTSRFFGGFIYDNNLFDLADFFSREYWIRNFPAIMSSIQRAGTLDSYYQIIVSALGPGSKVEFESPSPSHLIINIDVPVSIVGFGAWQDHEMKRVIPEQIPNQNSAMVFDLSLSQLTTNETLKMIELLNVNGVFVEVNISS